MTMEELQIGDQFFMVTEEGEEKQILFAYYGKSQSGRHIYQPLMIFSPEPRFTEKNLSVTKREK